MPLGFIDWALDHGAISLATAVLLAVAFAFGPSIVSGLMARRRADATDSVSSDSADDVQQAVVRDVQGGRDVDIDIRQQ